MKKNKKVKYDNVLLVTSISIFVVFLLITGFMVGKLIKDLKGNKESNVEVVDKMDDFGYQLTGNNTDYFKSLYYDLKDLLNATKKENFDEEYAKLVSRLFVVDFYDLNSKLDKTDVGGVQFIWNDKRESFKDFATDSKGIYYYVENNVYGKRKQDLPSVKKVEVETIETTAYSKDGYQDSSAYRVVLSIQYQRDLGYPEKCELILLHNKDKIEIIEVK